MYIAIAGNIGAGKTTLVAKLASHYLCRAEFEAADKNPYLQDFYQDMKRWSFPLQICFLSLRFQQAMQINSIQEPVILDRSIYEDAEIFATNLYQSELLTERDYHTYRLLYQNMVPLISPPRLLIYLKGSTELLSQRILQRNLEKKSSQKSEELIPIDYLNNLNKRYDEWIARFKLCPVITLNIDTFDLNQPDNLQLLLKKIDPFLKQPI